jgi:hypothetical protein
LNGDGWPDLVVADLLDSTVSVLLGDGTGGFGAGAEFATGYAPASVAIGDLNGDGKLDLVTANCDDNSVSMLPGDGAGGFGTSVDFPAGLLPSAVAIGDLNVDGKPDLAVANLWSNTVSVFLGDGAGGLETKIDFATGLNPVSLALGDFNGDGKPDLVTANRHSGTVSVRLALTPTRIAVAADPNPAVLGTPLNLNATVSVPAPGQGVPTGVVRFFDGTTLLGVSPVNGGAASLALSATHPGGRSITAVYCGDGTFSGSYSAAQRLVVTATATPRISGITDVEGDQGGQVRLRFTASPFDRLNSGVPIVTYEVFRRIDSGPGRPAKTLMDGWDLVDSLSARADAAYNIVAPTLADSNAGGIRWTTFLVRAVTGNPSIYYDSPPDSGYSVDNLPPAPPSHFAGDYRNGATILRWDKNAEPDLRHYRLYRGSTEDFVPGPENLISTVSDTNYVDTGPPGSFYKLSAVDVNDNEGRFASLGPVLPGGEAGGGAIVFGLDGARPNPALGGRLSIVFTLPNAVPAQLDLVDVSGRRLVRREVGSLGRGRHTVDLAAGLRLAPGVYMVRLTQGADVRATRAITLR